MAVRLCRKQEGAVKVSLPGECGTNCLFSRKHKGRRAPGYPERIGNKVCDAAQAWSLGTAYISSFPFSVVSGLLILHGMAQLLTSKLEAFYHEGGSEGNGEETWHLSLHRLCRLGCSQELQEGNSSEKLKRFGKTLFIHSAQ